MNNIVFELVRLCKILNIDENNDNEKLYSNFMNIIKIVSETFNDKIVDEEIKNITDTYKSLLKTQLKTYYTKKQHKNKAIKIILNEIENQILLNNFVIVDDIITQSKYIISGYEFLREYLKISEDIVNITICCLNKYDYVSCLMLLLNNYAEKLAVKDASILKSFVSNINKTVIFLETKLNTIKKKEFKQEDKKQLSISVIPKNNTTQLNKIKKYKYTYEEQKFMDEVLYKKVPSYKESNDNTNYFEQKYKCDNLEYSDNEDDNIKNIHSKSVINDNNNTSRINISNINDNNIFKGGSNESVISDENDNNNNNDNNISPNIESKIRVINNNNVNNVKDDKINSLELLKIHDSSISREEYFNKFFGKHNDKYDFYKTIFNKNYSNIIFITPTIKSKNYVYLMEILKYNIIYIYYDISKLINNTKYKQLILQYMTPNECYNSIIPTSDENMLINFTNQFILFRAKKGACKNFILNYETLISENDDNFNENSINNYDLYSSSNINKRDSRISSSISLKGGVISSSNDSKIYNAESNWLSTKKNNIVTINTKLLRKMALFEIDHQYTKKITMLNKKYNDDEFLNTFVKMFNLMNVKKNILTQIPEKLIYLGDCLEKVKTRYTVISKNFKPFKNKCYPLVSAINKHNGIDYYISVFDTVATDENPVMSVGFRKGGKGYAFVHTYKFAHVSEVGLFKLKEGLDKHINIYNLAFSLTEYIQSNKKYNDINLNHKEILNMVIPLITY